MKDLYTIKRGLNVNKKAFLTEQVSAIIQCNSPVKYNDPGCPTISVMIGGELVEKALLDMGEEWTNATHVWKHDIGAQYLLYVQEANQSGIRRRSIRGLLEPPDLLATLPPWRRIEEILPLFNEEETTRSS
ncbi:hypothetical protein CK203_062520 [Vitis vinifera]|uniref:Uncharacterized protein n=1 Tax=Vitis vinifera TaxID=29760 RepID=A0A438FWT3_VITVI|nr:hypothetical protein CK203_062520 [Vitis vinifera]